MKIKEYIIKFLVFINLHATKIKKITSLYIIFFIMFIIFNSITESKTIDEKYNYPFKNSNIATIIGSSMMMTEGIPKKVPTKVYKIFTKHSENIPKNMWFNKGMEFSLNKQKGEAPLIFLMTGSASSHDSAGGKLLQRILYNAGYHVITMPSVTHPNFILNSSNSRVPGLLMNDGKDMYNAMEMALNKVKKETNIKISDTCLTGYSLGATYSAILSYIDKSEKAFNFKRVYMINPAIDTYYSANALDNILYKNIKSKSEIPVMVNQLIETSEKELETFSIDNPESVIKKLFFPPKFTNEQIEEMIGFAFNLSSLELNYTVDAINNFGVYSDKYPNSKFTEMMPYFERVNFATYNEYVKRIVAPYYSKKYNKVFDDETIEEYSNLKIIENYLKNEKKIVLVTNEDDFILSNKNKQFIKKVFKGRYFIYPFGGHCGNMFYTDNVNKMLKFLKEGEFNAKTY